MASEHLPFPFIDHIMFEIRIGTCNITIDALITVIAKEMQPDNTIINHSLYHKKHANAKLHSREVPMVS